MIFTRRSRAQLWHSGDKTSNGIHANWQQGANMGRLNIRIDLDPGGRIGPGKIALLEHIDAAGSISAGARELSMSYKRAWDLVEELNILFSAPVVETRTGGKRGGGARLTGTGRMVVSRFRALEVAAQAAANEHIRAIQAQLAVN